MAINFPNTPANNDVYIATNNIEYIYTNGKWNGFKPIEPTIGNISSAGSLTISTASSERIRVLSTGEVGINIVSPTEKLHVVGNIKLSGAINANGSIGSAGDVLTSNGTTSYWTAPPEGSSLTIANTAPIAPEIGSMWFNSVNRSFNIYYDDGVTPAWVNPTTVNSSNNITLSTADTPRLLIDVSGNVGIGTVSPSYKLEVNGSFAATTKSFVIDHPTKDGYKLRYGSLEGPENGVYVRGRLKGKNVIRLPDHWVGLVDEESITVNLTPIGNLQRLCVQSFSSTEVVVAEDYGFDVDCFYIVFAERKDVDKMIVEYEAE